VGRGYALVDGLQNVLPLPVAQGSTPGGQQGVVAKWWVPKCRISSSGGMSADSCMHHKNGDMCRSIEMVSGKRRKGKMRKRDLQDYNEADACKHDLCSKQGKVFLMWYSSLLRSNM
jgi:hypothetical protein